MCIWSRSLHGGLTPLTRTILAGTPTAVAFSGTSVRTTAPAAKGLLMLVAILAVPILAYAILTWDQGFSQALVAKGVESPENYLNFFKNTDGSPISAVSPMTTPMP